LTHLLQGVIEWHTAMQDVVGKLDGVAEDRARLREHDALGLVQAS
jgi:hypothetical protein